MRQFNIDYSGKTITIESLDNGYIIKGMSSGMSIHKAFRTFDELVAELAVMLGLIDWDDKVEVKEIE